MNFNSMPFVALFATTFILYYLPGTGGRWQLLVLVTASIAFYGWEQPYLVLLLLFSGAITSLASFEIARSSDLVRSRVVAVAGVAAMLLVLAFFKYNRLFYETFVAELASASSPAEALLTLPLPIGISFFTFHGISLVVDTFTRKAGLREIPSRRSHLARTLLYITFFPQLIAGPIMKARAFFPQIGRKRLGDVDWELAARALIVGYFLKMVVADNLAVQTSAMSGAYVAFLPSLTLLLLIFAYSCQIFADFAGYSLIAIGLGRCLGYELMANFNFPYIAQSFSEFWHRWHISLSTWLRDYLFIPLGGSRRGALRTAVNIMIVMFLGGLWHGAAWSYAIWGTAHGLALVIERPFLGSRFYTSELMALRIVRTLIVFVVVSFAWLLFRLPDFGQVRTYLGGLASNWTYLAGAEVVMALVAYSLPVVIYHLAQFGLSTSIRPAARAWVHAGMVAMIVLNSGVPGAFIYFQF
jgi:alginate O-acetyltransferase complex protein AlgI